MIIQDTALNKPKKTKMKKEQRQVITLNFIKSLKIPENFEQKVKFLKDLKYVIEEIDLKMKIIITERQKYSEMIELVEKELKERNEKNISKNKGDMRILTIQEELYSKFKFKFS